MMMMIVAVMMLLLRLKDIEWSLLLLMEMTKRVTTVARESEPCGAHSYRNSCLLLWLVKVMTAGGDTSLYVTQCCQNLN
jgi:hypothetical protein